jgi:hypothetical protein
MISSFKESLASGQGVKKVAGGTTLAFERLSVPGFLPATIFRPVPAFMVLTNSYKPVFLFSFIVTVEDRAVDILTRGI